MYCSSFTSVIVALHLIPQALAVLPSQKIGPMSPVLTKDLVLSHTCSQDNPTLLRKEYNFAFQMAKKAESITESSNHFKALFSPGDTKPANLELQMQNKFK